MDENELIYIALCNSLNMYISYLEDNNISEEDKELIKYIITRQLSILDKYENLISEDTKIKRPKWNQE